MRLFLIVLTAFVCLASSVNAYCQDDLPGWHLAFNDMCGRKPAECAPYAKHEPAKVKMTAEHKEQLVLVDIVINHVIKYQRDADHYGVPDFWTYPADGKGDCEDYALEKRRRLVELGWPRRALRLAIVALKHHDDELHAVLLANTSAGLMVLDQRTDDLRDLAHLEDLDHVVSIQSAVNPRKWIDVQ